MIVKILIIWTVLLLSGCSDNEALRWASTATMPILGAGRGQGTTITEKPGFGTAEKLSGQGEANQALLHRIAFNLRGIN